MGKKFKKIKVNKKTSILPKENDSFDEIKEKFSKLIRENRRLKKKNNELSKKNKELEKKIVHVKKGLIESYEKRMEKKFNKSQKNKFLYNIDPLRDVENKDILSGSDSEYILDDGASTGCKFNALMEYQ